MHRELVRIPKNEDLEVVKFGIRVDAVCDYCGGASGWNSFKSSANRREYNLSGFCQACQDQIGGTPGLIKTRVPQPLGRGFKRRARSGR